MLYNTFAQYIYTNRGIFTIIEPYYLLHRFEYSLYERTTEGEAFCSCCPQTFE